jgi:hypothetical protein
MAVGNGVPFLGWASALGIAEETTYGTFKTATSFMEFTSESINQTREELKRESINTTRDYFKRLVGNEAISGSIDFDLNPAQDSNVLILKQAMGGTVASTLVSTGAYQHVISAGDMESNKGTSTSSDVKAISATIRRGGTSASSNVWYYGGGRVNTLSIKAESGAPVQVSAEMIFANTTVGATCSAATFTSILPLNFTGITIETGNSITSVTAEYFSSFEFSLSNNLIDQRVLGSRNAVGAPVGKRDVSLKLTQIFDTTTAYDRFIANTMTSFEITLDSGQAIANNTVTYGVTIKIPAGYVNSNQPTVGGPGEITHEMNVTAMYDSTTSQALEIIVKNATASYL